MIDATNLENEGTVVGIFVSAVVLPAPFDAGVDDGEVEDDALPSLDGLVFLADASCEPRTPATTAIAAIKASAKAPAMSQNLLLRGFRPWLVDSSGLIPGADDGVFAAVGSSLYVYASWPLCHWGFWF